MSHCWKGHTVNPRVCHNRKRKAAKRYMLALGQPKKMPRDWPTGTPALPAPTPAPPSHRCIPSPLHQSQAPASWSITSVLSLVCMEEHSPGLHHLLLIEKLFRAAPAWIASDYIQMPPSCNLRLCLLHQNPWPLQNSAVMISQGEGRNVLRSPPPPLPAAPVAGCALPLSPVFQKE